MGAADWISTHSTKKIEAHHGGIIGISGDNTMQLIPTDDEEKEEKNMGNFPAEITDSDISKPSIPTTSRSDYYNINYSLYTASNSK